MLTDAYQMILRAWANPYVQDITIAPYNPYPELEILDDKIWAEMSPEDRAAWIEENTEIVLSPDAVQPLPTVPQQKLTNAIPVPFPETIRNSIKKALDYQDKMGLPCTGPGSKQLSEEIVNNGNLGLKALKRLHNYLKARPQFENSPYSDGCEAIKYHAWGGKAMESFLESKLKEFDTWLN